MTQGQAALAFGLLEAIGGYLIFRWAMTLHNVPGSWMLFVSGFFFLSSIFTLGISAGLASHS